MARHVTAVIPAAGRATRLGAAISGSKEIVDVGGQPVLAHLLERLAVAGVGRAFVALRTEKWDIPAALVGDARHGIDLAYVVVDDSPSPAHSIVPALRFAAEDTIALGFPDVIFEPRDAFARMLARLTDTEADIVLGVFPSSTPERVDMVRLDDDRRVAEIVIKQPDRGLDYCWTMAVWSPSFTELLGHRIDDHGGAGEGEGEFQIGTVIQEAIRNGLRTESVIFDRGSYFDVGTPDDLAAARHGLDSA